MIQLFFFLTVSTILYGQTFLELLDDAVAEANFSYSISVIEPTESESIIELPEGVKLYACGLNYTRTNSYDTPSNSDTTTYTILSIDGRSKEFASNQIEIGAGTTNLATENYLQGNLSLKYSKFFRRKESWVELSDTNRNFYTEASGHTIPSKTALGFDPYLRSNLYQNINYSIESDNGGRSYQRVLFKISGNIFQDAKIHFNYSTLSSSGTQYSIGENKQYTVTLTKNYNAFNRGGKVISLNGGRGNWILNSISYTASEQTEDTP